MIGSQVNEISKPKTLKAFETQLLNNFTDSNLNPILPNNYAFEVNPFMLSKRENFSYLDYLKDTLSLWRNFSFSLASSRNYRINDTLSSNAIGLGGRTIVYNGKVSEAIKTEYKQTVADYQAIKLLEAGIVATIGRYLRDSLDNEVDLVALKAFLFQQAALSTPEAKAAINGVFSQLPANLTRTNIRPEFVAQFKKSISENALAEFRTLLDQVKTERFGWRVEVDAALALAFPTNEFGNSYVPRYGLWSAFSYRPFTKDKNDLKIPTSYEFIGLVRWIGNNQEFADRYFSADSLRFKTGSTFDLGLRFVKEFDRFSAEVEYIYRLNQNKRTAIVMGEEFSRTVNDDSYKLVVHASYKVSPTVVVAYNIGKNFDMPNLTDNDLISGFTINFAFGKVSGKDLLEAAKNELK